MSEEFEKAAKEYQDMVKGFSQDDNTLCFLVTSLCSVMHQQGQCSILGDAKTLEGLRAMQEYLLEDIFKRYSLLIWRDIKDTVLKSCSVVDLRKPTGEKKSWGTYKRDTP